ncbi:putative C2H2 finger domain protein [Aspergillus aculeatinus CBS 121060]|uniref:C2H2 finger domain protein n=1 Tax=Aspergillus aculeatinus CBS 121060 TaxID=1448322 RepID=A0ACD1H116_9EURO|nr:C2H2 finger domain protein [Aspergillus aculeatinus CBS 121060]RAH67234.1 C2H2 finger domain protein [Aspergillus aculeatinus CBS 121060]
MASLPYTCNTCLVAFRGSDAQRDHMRRDWHLYNMKRRIASLPPVSQETFNEKVLAAKATTTAAAAKAAFETTCVACQKTFYSENSYQNHIKSSKHKAREARMKREHADDASSVMSSTFSLGEPINKPQRVGEAEVSKVADTLKEATIEEENEEGEDEEMSDDSFSSARCLFCPNTAADIQENTEHMLKAHGMFIPEKEYLADLEGLLNYLYRKINENSECTYCHVIKNSPAAIRTHMKDKGHCMIAFESEDEQIEIGQYYDFRSTYSDDEGDWESTTSETPEEGGVKIEGEDEGWETETSASSVDEDELDNRKSAPVVYATDYELHLPSGKSVGHRSLAKYYRQNLHNYPSADERAAHQLAIENGEAMDVDEKPRGRNLNRALITRANGGTGMIGVSDTQKRLVVESERKERTRAIRQEMRHMARVNRAGNNQKHFRDPLLQ